MKTISVALCSLLIVADLVPVKAAPQDGTGNGMRETCATTTRVARTGRADLADASYCLGFIKAILFVGEHLDAESRFCPPRGATVQQAVSVFLKYLNDNPESTHYSGESLAVQAFQQV
jgi:Rap1a immunity proteins